jgi:integrase
MSRATKAKDIRTLDWGPGVVWKLHARKNGDGETEEVHTPYVRVRVTKDGRRRAVWQKVSSPADAASKLRRLTVKREMGEADELLRARMTFADLCKYYEPIYLIEAQYVDGRKVAGRRSLDTARQQFEQLRDYFGTTPLRSISYGSLLKLKSELLKAKTKRKGDDGEPRRRSIATVNRYLQLLRQVLNVAVREGWLQRNPFNAGAPLITISDERKRKRVLSRAEESRLLAACGERLTIYKRRGKELTMHDDGSRRAHLRPLLVCLLDTAMRSGEALKLTWDDLDFDTRHATVQEFNTKTLTERSAPVSARLARELARLYPVTSKRADRLVFGVTDNFRRSFAGACRHARITGLRVHDLRRTAATHLLRGGMPIEEIARILGHADIKTTYIYIGVDSDTVARAAAIFDRLNEEADAEAATRAAAELIN